MACGSLYGPSSRSITRPVFQGPITDPSPGSARATTSSPRRHHNHRGVRPGSRKQVAAAAKDPKEAETMLSGKLEAEEASSAAAAEDRKEFKLAMFHVSFFLSAGVLLTLLSFLVPGASRRFQILCWQTAIVSFVSEVDIVRRHPVVWCVLRESGEPSKKI